MKTKINFAAIGIIIGLLTVNTLNAQVKISVNIEQQPIWGPTGYDHVDYYYMPDIDVYYDISRSQYIYLQNNKWVFKKSLPSKYKSFDLYKGYKVVINEDKPYLRHDEQRNKYSKMKNRSDQTPIRDSKDSRYYANKTHPQHQTWKKQQKKG